MSKKPVKRGRGRPPKDKGTTKSVDLRIPVTEDQKTRIVSAATHLGLDMTAWARPILLKAAEAQLRKIESLEQAVDGGK
jgi:hypothetical protein